MMTGPVAVNPADAYERFLVPYLFAPWADDLLHRAAVRPGERVLDVACGIGIVARRAASRLGSTGRVIGVDPNPGMLATARAAASREQLDTEIEWIEGRAESLPADDGAFDLVCCQMGLQFFSDRAGALQEFHRTLVPGGRVALSVGQGIERQTLHADLDDIIARQTGYPVFGPTVFSLGDRNALHALLHEAGFRDIAVESVAAAVRFPDPTAFVTMQLRGAAAAVPGLAAMDPATLSATIDAVQESAIPALSRYVDHGSLNFTIHNYVVQGRR